MSYNKKIKKIIDRMSDNKEKNKKIILRNILKIEKECKDSFVAREIVLTRPEEDKLLKFMDSYLEILKYDSVFGGPEKISEFLGFNLGDFNSIPPLLHTLIECEYSMSFIKKLLDLIDGYFTTYSKSYTIYIDELIYKDNIIGQDFISYYLEKAITNKINLNSDFNSLKDVIKKYNIDLGQYDVPGDNSLKFLDKIENSTENIMNPDQTKELKQLIYQNSVITLLTFNKEKDLEMINSILGDINYYDEGGSLLHYCFKYPNFLVKNIRGDLDKFILKRVYYLLELGVDPNIPDMYGNSFIEVAIDVSDNIDYAFCRDIKKLPAIIKEILTISDKYEFNIICNSRLFETFLNKISTIGEAIDVYKFLCDHGYNTYLSVSSYDIISEITSKQSVIDFVDINFRDLYYFNLNRDLLVYLLEVTPLTMEDNFIVKYNNILCPELNMVMDYNKDLLFDDYNDFVEKLVEFYGMTSIKDYFEYLIDTIIKLRSESIMVQNNKVTVKELLEAIKYTIIEKEKELNNTSNKFVHTAKEFEQKNLIYKYINKVQED